MKTIKFDKEPQYADLWDACLYNFLYDKKKYLSEVISLFKKIAISKKSLILDSSAGTGFIALYLRKKGYSVNCMDPMDDEISVFKRKAKKLGTSQQIKKIFWTNIPTTYKKNKFNFIFCRGNSFIYADGGWNEKQKINKKSALKSYKQTLQIFYNQLKVGGFLYIDKFPDNEISHKNLVGFIQIKNQKKEDLLFYTKRIPKKRSREAMMIRKKTNGKEEGIPNITFDLKEKELEEMMKKVGFKVQKLKLKSEKHFVVWLAKK